MARYSGVGAGDLMGRLVEQLADLPGISTRAAERIAFHLMARPVGETEDLARTLLEFRRTMRLCSVCFQHCTGPICGLCANPNRNHRLICVVEMAADIAAFERSGAYQGAYHVLLGRLSPLSGVLPEDLTGAALLTRVAGRLGQGPGPAPFAAEIPAPPADVVDGDTSDAAEQAHAAAAAAAALADGDSQQRGRFGADVPVEAELAREAELADLVARYGWLAAPAEEVILATSATAEGEATAAWLEQILAPFDVAVTRIARGLPIGAEVAFAQRSTLATALKNRLSVRK